MKKQSKTESVEYVLNIGDMLLDYTQDEEGNMTEEFAIGYVCKVIRDGLVPLYIVDWSDCGEEEHYADNAHLITWRNRYLEFEKKNRLDNPESAAAGTR